MRRMTASVQKVLRAQRETVGWSNSWAKLHEELGVGTRVGKTLHLAYSGAS